MWSLFIARRAPENARSPAVISTGGWAVYDVADVPILWAFCCVVDTLSEHCLRRRSSANPLSLLFSNLLAPELTLFSYMSTTQTSWSAAAYTGRLQITA